ncbi:MAG: DUF3179 domain-containing protein [Planctomycetes bacterium]|nr:DUF3179 domain-containing protein [Planctomycetota bacterium]
MYDRRLDGEVLEFGHAGMLYNQSFVLYDKKTESLWVHVTGEARTGPLKGKRLAFYPSVVMTWKEWKTAHPATIVMKGEKRGGFMGTFQGTSSRAQQEFGLSVQIQGTAKLYRYRDLASRGVVNDVFREVPIAVVFHPDRNVALAFERKVDGRVVALQADGANEMGYPILRDREGGSTWDGLTGARLSGPSKATRLEPLTATPILIERWSAFFPDGEVYAP